MSLRSWKVVALWAGLAAVAGAAQGPGRALRLGRATDQVEKDHKRIQALADYLAARLGDAGVQRGEVLLAADNRHETVIRYLKEGRLDLVLESPFAAAQYWAEGAAFPLAAGSTRGRDYLHSIIFVRKDSGLRKLEDLRGRAIAFQDPGSTASCHLPKHCLSERGLRLLELRTFPAKVPPDQVGYVFATQELNIASWVYFGKVAAGALSDSNWASPEVTPAHYKKEFAILHESPKVLTLVIMARRGLEPKLAARLREELLKINENPAGKALAASWINRYFIPEAGLEAEMTRVRKMAAGAE